MRTAPTSSIGYKVDRFTVGPDGLATERVNYHDSVAMAWRLLSQPGGWFRLLRSGGLRRGPRPA
ncbi:MAG: hypothetical protein ACRDZ7_08910 [Acidimicrobiia bacterium]